jgi:cell wall-associated NlpC family hydrolase
MARLALATGMVAMATLSAPVAADNASFAVSARETVSDVAGKVRDGAHDLAVYALGLLGVRYRFGGESPESGLDCSGLVRHVFQQVTGVTLPRTAKEMSRVGDGIARHELEPGDLVFFNTRRMPFSHVGIYLGGNRFVHAPRRGREVEVADLGNRYWQQQFDGARRIAGAIPALTGLPSALTRFGADSPSGRPVGLMPPLIASANAAALPAPPETVAADEGVR